MRKMANPTSYRNFASQHSKKIVVLRICNTFIIGNMLISNQEMISMLL
jgi:hypothetical protein